jgi:hypothetical protein
MELIHQLSIGTVWLPLILLTFQLSYKEKEFLLFWCFLLASGLIDLVGFLIPMTEEGDQIYYPIHLIYLCIEGNLILLFSFKFISWPKGIKSLIKKLGIIVLFLFTFLIPLTLLSGDWEKFINLSSIFSASLLVFFSFSSAFGLLGLAETNFNLLSSPWFWILAGVFTYSFGSFFIDLLIPTQTAHEVYFLRHIMNVMRGCFFLIGVLKIYLNPKAVVSS